MNRIELWGDSIMIFDPYNGETIPMFRVWSNLEQRYLPGKELALVYVDDRGEVKWKDQWWDALAVVVERCTGQKDSSGKWIYEGDILYCEKDPVVNDDYDDIGYVLYDISCTNFVVINEVEDWWTANIDSYCSIIGNIYENRDKAKEIMIDRTPSGKD